MNKQAQQNLIDDMIDRDVEIIKLKKELKLYREFYDNVDNIEAVSPDFRSDMIAILEEMEKNLNDN